MNYIKNFIVCFILCTMNELVHSSSVSSSGSSRFIPSYDSLFDDYDDTLVPNSSSSSHASRSTNSTPSIRSSAQDKKIVDELENATQSSKNQAPAKKNSYKSYAHQERNTAHDTYEAKIYQLYKKEIQNHLLPALYNNNQQAENKFIQNTITTIKKDLNPSKKLNLNINQYINIFQRLKHESSSPKLTNILENIVLQLIDLQLTDDDIKLALLVSSLSHDDIYPMIQKKIDHSTPSNTATTISYLKDFCTAVLANEIIDLEDLLHIFNELHYKYALKEGNTSHKLLIISQIGKKLIPKTPVLRNSDAVEALLETINEDRSGLANNDITEEQTPQEVAGIQADALIEKCYFSPDMQFAVTSYINQDLFKLNVVTGKPQNIPTVYDIIAAGQIKRSEPAEKKARTYALQAALEATKLAQFLAGLDAAYEKPTNLKFAPTVSSNYLMPSVDEDLKKALKNREKNLRDALGNTTWWAWIPDWSWFSSTISSFFTSSTQSNSAQKANLHFRADYRDIDDNTNQVTIPDTIMKTIIKNYDYKQIISNKGAANLLFKQCFIAQQQFTNNDWPLYTTPKHSPISATNYIFEGFIIDAINNSSSKSTSSQSASNAKDVADIDLMIKHIKSALHNKKHTPDDAHALLIAMRKAVQTAMFIANRNSNFNIFYTLPSIAVKFLDGILTELNQYDRMLDNLCQDQSLGAHKDDQFRRARWNTISYILTAGIVVGGTVVAIKSGAAQYAYNNLLAPQPASVEKKQPAPAETQKNEKTSHSSVTTPNKPKNSAVLQAMSYGTQIVSPIKNQTHNNNSQTKNIQQTNTQNISTSLMDYIADMMNSPQFTESREVPYWQAGGDAELYGMSGYSHNDVIGTAAAVGVGNVARAGYNYITKVGETAGQGALEGVSNFGKHATPNTAKLASTPAAGGIGATIAGTAQTSTNKVGATFADGITPAAKIIESNVPRATFASAEPYIATAAADTGILTNAHIAGQVGASIAGTGRVVTKAARLNNLPRTTQVAVGAGLLVTAPKTTDIASDAPLHTEEKLNTMQSFYEQKEILPTENIIIPTNVHDETQLLKNENVSKEVLDNNIQVPSNDNIAQEEQKEV